MGKKEQKQEVVEMSVEEAKALRAAKHASIPKKSSESDNKEAFRLFWAKEKASYGKEKSLESVLWVHLKAIKMDSPEKFTAGISHFGLKKIS